MGFGASTTVGNVAVDLVQADVDGIIAGIAGVTPKTLADIQDDTSYLYSSSAGYGVADLLYSSNYSTAADLLDNIDYNTYDIYNETSNYLYYLSDIADNTYDTYSDISNYLYYLDYLYSSSGGYGVADLLYSSSASYSLADMFYDYQYDSSNYKPWLQEMCELLNGYDSSSVLISNGYTAAYLLEQIYTILSDVWDSGNHALKTIDQAA